MHADGSMQDCVSNIHDDVIKWKHFPRYWPFVRGIHRSPVNSPHKGQWRGALKFTLICVWINGWVKLGFRSRFSQCVDYMRFNEKSFCFRWQETTKLMLFCNTKTSSLVMLCDLRYLTGNISSAMTKHMGVQRKLHRFAYLIVQIISCFYS